MVDWTVFIFTKEYNVIQHPIGPGGVRRFQRPSKGLTQQVLLGKGLKSLQDNKTWRGGGGGIVAS